MKVTCGAPGALRKRAGIRTIRSIEQPAHLNHTTGQLYLGVQNRPDGGIALNRFAQIRQERGAALMEHLARSAILQLTATLAQIYTQRVRRIDGQSKENRVTSTVFGEQPGKHFPAIAATYGRYSGLTSKYTE